MKDKRGIIISVLLIIISIYSICSILTDAFCKYQELNYVMLFIVIIIGFIILVQYLKNNKLGLNVKEKLVNYLVQDSSTVYIMVNKKNNNIIYLSESFKDILGIKEDDKILNNPVIKSELNKWDRNSEYISQMIEYDNPKYNHKMWIKIKISPYKEKAEEYFIIQITDASKEHDRQHLLISQATDIKSRQNILNQITAKSYDFEIN